MGLIDKIKNRVGIGLVAGALYVSSLLPSVYAQEKPQLQLPDKLTQQTADFYKNPEKEFEFYFQTYHKLAEDKVIDSNDVETLAFVLTKTLEEIQAKISSNETTDFASANKYVEFCMAKTNGDLACLNSYLGMKKKMARNLCFESSLLELRNRFSVLWRFWGPSFQTTPGRNCRNTT